MRTTAFLPLIRLLVAVLMASPVTTPAGAAEEVAFRKTVGDTWVYLNVMPTELISGPAPAPEAGATPFRPPSARDTHHVMVSLFGYRTGTRITDARVDARVAAVGFSGVRKTLESAVVAGAPMHVGLFPMTGRGPFRIDIDFQNPTASAPQRATFYFTHPSFRRPKEAK